MMNKLKYKYLRIILPFFALLFFIWLAETRTDGFTSYFITRLESDEKKNDMQICSEIDEIKSILSQQYYYLTRGKQSFIFESNDKKYILKLFDNSRYFTKFYMPYLSLPKFFNTQIQKFYCKKRHKLMIGLSSAKIAYENLKDDAVLKYVNLTKTNVFNDKLCITNKCKRVFLVDLNDVFFILQKKCDLFYSKYETSDEAYKNHLIESFLDMVHRRSLKLVVDNDVGKNKTNWGVYDDKAVTIDIGRWYIDESLKTFKGYKKHMLKGTITLRKYLLENDPKKIAVLDEKLKQYFESFVDRP